jgi:hypothetical protein
MTGLRLTKGSVLVGGLDQDGLAVRSLRIPLRPTAGIAQVLSGKSVPAGSLILGAYVKMTTGASAATVGASTLNVGNTTATIAYLAGLNIATAGIKQGSLATAGTTLGASLRDASDAGLVPRPAAVDVATQITYATLAPSPNLNGELIIEYRKLG